MTHETSTSGRRPSTEDLPAVSTKASSDPVVNDRDDAGNRAMYNSDLGIDTAGSNNTNTLEVPRPNLGYSKGTNSGARGSTNIAHTEASLIPSHGSGPGVPAHTTTLQPTADARQPLVVWERFYKRRSRAAKRFFKTGWAKISSLITFRVRARARPESIAEGIENSSQQNPSTSHEPDNSNTSQVIATEDAKTGTSGKIETVNPAPGIQPGVSEHHLATKSQQNIGTPFTHDGSYPLPTNATSDKAPEILCLNCPLHCRASDCTCFLSTGDVPSLPAPYQPNRRHPAVPLGIETLGGTLSPFRPPVEGSRRRRSSDSSLLQYNITQVGAHFGSRESSRVRSRIFATYPSVVDPSLSSRPASGAFRSDHTDHALANGIPVANSRPSATDPAEEEVNHDRSPLNAG